MKFHYLREKTKTLLKKEPGSGNLVADENLLAFMSVYQHLPKGAIRTLRDAV